MFFAKGEIIMNSIYKVIWSKAKNCYVVASEIARSHTKSASGSEKIGGVARHALLALGAACAIACGGFVNVGAAEKVDVQTTGGSTAMVYTADGTESFVRTELEAKLQSELGYYAKYSETYTKTQVDEKLGALTTTGDVATNRDNITALQTTTGEQQTAINELQKKTTRIEYDTANDTTSVNGMKVGQQVDMGGKNLTKVGTINGIDLGTNESGNYISQDGSILGNMKKVDTQVGKNAVAIGENTTAIEELGTKVGAVGTGDYLDPTKSVGENLGLLDAGLKKEVADRTAADTALSDRIGTVADDGNYIKKSATNNVSENLKVLDTEIAKTNDRTKGITRNADDTQTTIEGKVTVDKDGNVGGVKDLTVDGKLNVGEISMKNDRLDPNGDQHASATTITADGISNNAKVTDKNGVITESKFTHDKEGSTTYAYQGDAANWKKSTSNVTADGVENVAEDSKGNNNTFTQTSTDTKNTLTDKEGNTSTTRQDSKGIYGYAKDKDGNKSYTKQEGNRIAESVIGQDGKQTKSEMTSTDITNTAKDGTIKNDAKDIVNNATGDMTNTVGGKLTTTVAGQATENFNSGLDTTVTGTENHTVNGKQINTVTEGQENIISGGQTNTITGGQINNITGDQTTTITGKKTETVTENVTEDYKKNLTTTVGGNEIHDVKGTKTETVEGKLTENFKGGQETNVTGDQTTNVSGTQTITATDINRNASSSMVDKVDNAYGTNTETKEAGKTTTDVSIKGTGEKGQYIRGANESRDYLIKGTLTNTETKTAEATSSEITDGTNKASTRQDAKNLAGSVTNGTETGVSGIHANDDGSVSIDSGVTDGSMSSVINQKKDSIQSAVGDGTNSTVIHQDKDNVTIASSNGTVGIVGKDIVNNAKDTITNTAGTKITDTAGDSTVTTENGKGTTFSRTGSTAYREGGPTDTNISGNTITTGKVTMDYADVMKDLGVHGNAKVDQNLEVGGTSTLKGDVTMESNAKVKKDLTVEGTTTTKTLKVTENAEVDGTLKVAKKATFEDSVSIAKDLSVGGDVTANSYKVGDKTYISAAGINANDQKITNVADGSISEGSKDAVNGGQLYGVKRDLEHQVDKVGANAAAMANLRPMEFDPSSKWNIAAAIGNYGSETAAALGAFYRPNDNVMVNLSTAFGTGENMVGGGVSVRLGKGGNKLSREETNALKAQVADLTARMDALLSVLNPNMSKDFPDVPENHWAYEAVSRLAGNDIVQGYPDGEFHGERTMTRYEMAEIIYNALSRGAEAERELVEEFKPELQAMAASEKATAEKAEG